MISWSTVEGFDVAMDGASSERARAAGQFKGNAQISAEAAAALPATEFLGYDTGVAECRDRGHHGQDGRRVDALEARKDALLILDRTPFYAESGGQVGDTGTHIEADGVVF